MIKILNNIGSHIDHNSTNILNTNLHRNKQKKNQITFDNGQVGNAFTSLLIHKCALTM